MRCFSGYLQSTLAIALEEARFYEQLFNEMEQNCFVLRRRLRNTVQLDSSAIVQVCGFRVCVLPSPDVALQRNDDVAETLTAQLSLTRERYQALSATFEERLSAVRSDLESELQADIDAQAQVNEQLQRELLRCQKLLEESRTGDVDKLEHELEETKTLNRSLVEERSLRGEVASSLKLKFEMESEALRAVKDNLVDQIQLCSSLKQKLEKSQRALRREKELRRAVQKDYEQLLHESVARENQPNQGSVAEEEVRSNEIFEENEELLEQLEEVQTLNNQLSHYNEQLEKQLEAEVSESKAMTIDRTDYDKLNSDHSAVLSLLHEQMITAEQLIADLDEQKERALSLEERNDELETKLNNAKQTSAAQSESMRRDLEDAHERENRLREELQAAYHERANVVADHQAKEKDASRVSALVHKENADLLQRLEEEQKLVLSLESERDTLLAELQQSKFVLRADRTSPPSVTIANVDYHEHQLELYQTKLAASEREIAVRKRLYDELLAYHSSARQRWKEQILEYHRILEEVDSSALLHLVQDTIRREQEFLSALFHIHMEKDKSYVDSEQSLIGRVHVMQEELEKTYLEQQTDFKDDDDVLEQLSEYEALNTKLAHENTSLQRALNSKADLVAKLQRELQEAAALPSSTSSPLEQGRIETAVISARQCSVLRSLRQLG